MDPLDFLECSELLQFLHCHKTELSCMENPRTFLSQLRDHNLIPEDGYKKVSRMKSKENMKKSIYEILDWLEKEHSEHIHLFWKCIFKETILNHYPTLRILRNSLMDGSFHFVKQIPEMVEKLENSEKGKKRLSEDEDTEENVMKKKKLRRKSTCDDDEEQPGPSSQITSNQKKKMKKICFYSPQKGEKNDFCSWPLYKTQLPVTCGKVEGSLSRDRLAKGDKCILVDKQWFTPGEFERFAGRGSAKNWKLSIRCMKIPLGKLIKEGQLKSARFIGGNKQVKKPLFHSDNSTTGDDEEDEESNLEDQEESRSSSRDSTDFTEEGEEEMEEQEEQEEQQPETSPEHSKTKFHVTCGALSGTLYKRRFASGTRGKSIRTETTWMTPVKFTDEALGRLDGCWKKDITYNGKPLNALIEAKVLVIHSLLCSCKLCQPDPEDLEDQKNDDECCVCKSEGEEDLVVCDHCPRSFHQKCHLPNLEDSIVRDDKAWMCTFCIFASFQQYRSNDEQELSAVLSFQISKAPLECQYLLLYLCSADEEQTFATDPSLYLENYSSLIKAPMWLCRIADKLQRKEYQTVGQFVSDIQLIFSNCATYNRNNAEYLAEGDRLKQLFDREFRGAFRIP